MKKSIVLVLVIVLILSYPISAYAGGNRDRNETETSGDILSLLEAVEHSAEKIASELPEGSRVAVVAFESDSENLSQFIMEELVGALHDRRIEVADRENLPFLERELNFQLSGNVSDESMQSIGKFLGAELVITGQMRHLGNTYRFTTNAIRVETAVHVSIPRLNIRNDGNLQNMITALNSQTTVVRQARYTVPSTPQTAGSFLDRGIARASRGEYEAAIADFTEALHLNPNMVSAYIMRGRALFASVTNIVAAGENFSFLRYESSGELSAEQRRVYDLAITDFNQALNLDPENAQIYHERGNVYLAKKDNDHAISSFTQAIRINPDFMMAYYMRARAYNGRDNSGDLDRAITDLTHAIHIDPNFWETYLIRGGAYLMRHIRTGNNHDLGLSITDYTQGIQLNPDFAMAYILRGAIYKTMYLISRNNNYLDLAITDFEAALRIDPTDMNTRQELENARRERSR